MSVRNPLAGAPLRAARWSATHPWRAILGWLALVVVAVVLASAVPTNTADDADYREHESGRAAQWIDDAGLSNPLTENVLVTAGASGLDPARAEAAAAEIVREMAEVPGVEEAMAPVWSSDRSALLVAVRLAADHEETKGLTAVTEAVQEEYADLRVRQAGDLTIDEGVGEQIESDLASAEGISLPVTLVLMMFAFGALVAAGIPVLLAASSVAVTIGITAPVSWLVPAEPTVTSMIVLIGMAVGVDYSLFYLKREREERARGRSTLDAVEIAAETSGHSILVSGLAAVVAMSGLYVVGGVTFNSLATGAILVVAIAVLGSITVLPALLVKLGRWVDRPRVPGLWRLNRRIGRGGISRRLLEPVLRRPAVALVLGGAVVVALAVPMLGMKVHSANLETLPASIPEVATASDMAKAFPLEGASVEVVVRAGDADTDPAQVRSALSALDEAAARTGDFVAGGASAARVSDDGRTMVLDLAIPHEESDPRVDDAVELLREDLVPTALAGLDVDRAVGGGAAESYDSARHLATYLPIVIGFVVLLTMVMMVVAFRSVLLALVSSVLNLASVAVAFGMMTLVFQHGWFAGALDFTSPGFLIDWIPMIVLVILVGLSMDYHVFVLSRIREHVRRGLPARLAVEQGVIDTAGVVTSAAGVMVSVFAIFATLSMLEMKMMGVGLAVAILLDATLIRLVMLPAVLVLLGDRVWARSEVPGEPVVEPAPVLVVSRP
ncbi:putative drug exporter of the RND superfamily [Nocardioides alpinus]|uniref:Putative drug exporter of the RND superfamily n=1 Tax=Nocardioides alpinus TaxID=748909 RepID=A0A1I1AUZ2_9ACTN|nr:MMPL family transporter [Nocardioides alpinus]PKH40904.1 RND transporter [Nocardioides alpinus]SFB41864.1 putative drug exporter of the RND superfamily [Nocardioides alpinus]